MRIPESEFRKVEATFGITLPASYRELLESGTQPAAVVEWFDSAQALIDANTLLLDDDTWDPAYFAIATDGAGDYYCLELETADVALFSHEESDFHDLGPFNEWVANPVAATEPGSAAIGLIGCAAIGFLLLLILGVPTWFALRASP